jgi:hypothetical protein
MEVGSALRRKWEIFGAGGTLAVPAYDDQGRGDPVASSRISAAHRDDRA